MGTQTFHNIKQSRSIVNLWLSLQKRAISVQLKCKNSCCCGSCTLIVIRTAAPPSRREPACVKSQNSLITSRTPAGHTQVQAYSDYSGGAILSFFCPAGAIDTLHSWGEIQRTTPPRQILPVSDRGMGRGPKTVNFTKFRNINVPQVHISCTILTTKFSEFVGRTVMDPYFESGEIS